MGADLLPSTVAVIVLLALLVSIPITVYLSIIGQFVFNRQLQLELKGKRVVVVEEETSGEGGNDRREQSPEILLAFKSISYSVSFPISNGTVDSPDRKYLLKDVSGWFAPGTLTAIIGSSGSGKTSLLSVLAGFHKIQPVTTSSGDASRQRDPNVNGSISVNGRELGKEKGLSLLLRRHSAFVMQSVTLHESLTVRETLWFTVELRSSAAFKNQAERFALVTETLTELNLVHVAETRVGLLSGGQKRLLSIAVELVVRPSCILLDEPTTGLDARASLLLMRVLRGLCASSSPQSSGKRTIVCTIHQPRLDVYRLFHMVLLLHGGRSLYFGPGSELLNYFSASDASVSVRLLTASDSHYSSDHDSLLHANDNDEHRDPYDIETNGISGEQLAAGNGVLESGGQLDGDRSTGVLDTKEDDQLDGDRSTGALDTNEDDLLDGDRSTGVLDTNEDDQLDGDRSTGPLDTNEDDLLDGDRSTGVLDTNEDDQLNGDRSTGAFDTNEDDQLDGDRSTGVLDTNEDDQLDGDRSTGALDTKEDDQLNGDRSTGAFDTNEDDQLDGDRSTGAFDTNEDDQLDGDRSTGVLETNDDKQGVLDETGDDLPNGEWIEDAEQGPPSVTRRRRLEGVNDESPSSIVPTTTTADDPLVPSAAFSSGRRTTSTRSNDDTEERVQQLSREEVNPADFVLDLIHSASFSEETTKQLSETYAQSSWNAQVIASVDQLLLLRSPSGESLEERELLLFGYRSGLLVMPPPLRRRRRLDESPIGISTPSCCLSLKCCRARQVIPPPPPTTTEGEEGSSHHSFKNTAATTRGCSCSRRWKQTMMTLVRRQFVVDCRNRSYLMTFVLGIIMMVFLGLLYLNVSKPPFAIYVLPSLLEENLRTWGACTQSLTDLATIITTAGDSTTEAVVRSDLLQCGEDIQQTRTLALARQGFLYQVLVAMFFSEFPMVAQIHQDLKMLHREAILSRSYSVWIWSTNWAIKIFFVGLIKGLVYPPFVYFLAKLPLELEPYVLFSLFVGIMSIAGGCAALLCCVVFFHSFESAQVGFILIKTVSQALSGYFITKRYIPWWFRWMYYLNFFRYTFEGSTIGISLSEHVYDPPWELGEPQTRLVRALQRESWNYAVVSIMFCLCFHLLTMFVLWIRTSTHNGNQRVCGRCRSLRNVIAGSRHDDEPELIVPTTNQDQDDNGQTTTTPPLRSPSSGARRQSFAAPSELSRSIPNRHHTPAVSTGLNATPVLAVLIKSKNIHQ